VNSLTVNGTLQYDAVLRAVTGHHQRVDIAGRDAADEHGGGPDRTYVDGRRQPDERRHTRPEHVGQYVGRRLTFTGAASNTFSGVGLTTDLRTLTINKGTSNANVLEITTSALSVQGTVVDGTPMAYLTITNGTLKISGTFAFAGRTFTAAGYSIPATGGFWLNNPNYTVSGQNGSPSLGGSGAAGTGTPGTAGLLRVSAARSTSEPPPVTRWIW
jgi:hypothetical protein